jgi:glycosyltransferase involved in cell wall biosynthesis
MPKISVVVPVYRGEKYLRECIESILGQTFKDFELLLLDDGSPDHSGDICDRYAQKDDRVRVIHKENEGINATRRRGVHEAKGEWVAFCDDDDTMEPDALKSMYSLTDETDIVTSFSILPDKRLPENAGLFSCRKAFLSGELSPTPWAKLYKRKLLTDDVFDFPREIDGEEDMIMNTRLFFKTNVPPKVLYRHVYNFRRNTASVSHTKKVTIAHEKAFYCALYDSIPEAERGKFMRQITNLKLNGLFPIAYSVPESLIDKQQPYLKQIMDDAKECEYHFALKERLLLHSSSRILIKLIGFTELVRRFLWYRLHSAFNF